MPEIDSKNCETIYMSSSTPYEVFYKGFAKLVQKLVI